MDASCMDTPYASMTSATPMVARVGLASPSFQDDGWSVRAMNEGASAGWFTYVNDGLKSVVACF